MVVHRKTLHHAFFPGWNSIGGKRFEHRSPSDAGRIIHGEQWSVLASGALIGLLGAAVLIGWHARIPSLIQIHPDFVPMQYNTALCFLLTGVALIAAVYRRYNISTACAGAVTLIGFATLIEYGVGTNLGIDELFMRHYIDVHTSNAGRMAPNTALCFLLAGTTVALSPLQPRWARLRAVLAFIVCVVALTAFLGYMRPLHWTYNWGEFTHMAVHTAAGFLGLGLGLFITSIAPTVNHRRPLPITLLLFLSLVLAYSTELLTPFGVVVGLLYVPALFLNIWLGWSKGEFILAGAVSLLIAVGYWIEPAEATAPWVALANRFLHIPAIWLIAGLLYVTRREKEDTANVSRRLEAIMDGAASGIFVTDSKGVIQTVNRAARRIYGCSEEELIGRTVDTLICTAPVHAGNAGPDRDSYRALQTDSPLPGGGRVGRRKSGEQFSIDATVSHIRLADNENIDVWMFRDVTAHNAAIETALKERDSRLTTMFRNSIDGIVTTDAAGRIDGFNPAAERIFGYREEQIRGRTMDLLIPDFGRDVHTEDAPPPVDADVPRVVGITREVQARRKDGTVFDIDLSASRITIADETAFSYNVRDISKRKAVELELQKTLENLSTSNEELETFAYVASHDLKSPLRAIDNLSKWLSEDLGHSIDDTNRDRLGKLRSRVRRMERLLDDLLSYSRAGRLSEPAYPTIAADLIGETWDLLNTPDGFTMTIDPALGEIEIPRVPLEQVFQNLIDNAVKHHDRVDGHVRISGKKKPGFYEFVVSDDGPGIRKEFHEKVFEMFQTLQPRDTTEGSGMGMALVKKIITRFGGTVWLECAGERGTSAHFTWPDERVGPQSPNQRAGEQRNANQDG